MNVTPLQILQAAHAKIEDPSNWTTYFLAVDELNRSIDPRHRLACKFCAIGALDAVSPLDSRASLKAQELLDQATLDLVDPANVEAIHVPDVNYGFMSLKDGSTGHPAVLKIYDRAIELAAH